MVGYTLTRHEESGGANGTPVPPCEALKLGSNFPFLLSFSYSLVGPTFLISSSSRGVNKFYLQYMNE
jgi:hypothetical protein